MPMSINSSKPGVNERLAQSQNRLIEHLRSSEKRYSDLVEHLRDVVFQLDVNLNWHYLNKAWHTLSGFSVDETINTPFINYLLKAEQPLCNSGFKALLNGQQQELTLQIHLISADQQCHIVELSCRAFKNELGHFQGIAGILSDITERVKAQSKITHLAYHDALTGLANRRLMLTYLQDILDSPSIGGLIFIDLDDFKGINDNHGHFIGDLLLCSVAKKIEHLLANRDALASRVGGDEFVICMNFETEDADNAQQQLLGFATLLGDSIAKEQILDTTKVSIRASIGALLLNSGHIDPEQALHCVDAAMYKSKRQGQNRTQLYDKTFEQEQNRLKTFKEDIENAVQVGEFQLYYQPQVDLVDNYVVKVEALIRWNHPLKGMILPDNFIPYLEQSGLIVQVGAWVLNEGCRQLKTWINQGIDKIVMSINVSAHQFMQPNFMTLLSDCLHRHNIPRHLLELELTESVAIKDVKLAIDKMREIQQLGVKLALDDFGTGYSSLAYLKNFPVHTLKIDKSFINGIPNDGYDTTIIETTLVMAKHLGIEVVAEGVENNQQLAFLKKLNCQLYQGFLYSKPLCAADVLKLLIKNIKHPKPIQTNATTHMPSLIPGCR